MPSNTAKLKQMPIKLTSLLTTARHQFSLAWSKPMIVMTTTMLANSTRSSSMFSNFQTSPRVWSYISLMLENFLQLFCLVSFECTITVCHETTPECFLDSNSNPVDGSCDSANIWSDPTVEGRRKRSSIENDQNDYKLTATLNFQRKYSNLWQLRVTFVSAKSSNNSATLIAGSLFAAFMLLL